MNVFFWGRWIGCRSEEYFDVLNVRMVLPGIECRHLALIIVENDGVMRKESVKACRYVDPDVYVWLFWHNVCSEGVLVSDDDVVCMIFLHIGIDRMSFIVREVELDVRSNLAYVVEW